MSSTKIIAANLVLTAMACGVAPQIAQAGHGKWFDQTGVACCPVCDHVCKLEAKAIEVEKSCFEVETKVICIPRVVFPWQTARKASCASCDSCSGKGCNACVHSGARLRKICVLKPKAYTCPACEYTWSAEKKDACECGSEGCCGARCDSLGSAASALIESTTNAPGPPSLPATRRTTAAIDSFR